MPYCIIAAILQVSEWANANKVKIKVYFLFLIGTVQNRTKYVCVLIGSVQRRTLFFCVPIGRLHKTDEI